MSSRFFAALVIAIIATGPARAQMTTQLPLSLAMEAVDESIRVCMAKGYKVAVAVVDPDGVIQIEARGDGSPIHSQRFAFRKAFTIVSMGPVFGVDTSSALVTRIGSVNPVGLANISGGATDLLFLPGAVLLKSGSQAIGAIGVSGAPISAEDETCARAGRDRIQDRLDRALPDG